MEARINKYLAKVAPTLDDANFLRELGQLSAATNRAYYAIFYSVCALLLSERVLTIKYEEAREKFHESFIKTKKLPVESIKLFEQNYEARQLADYDMNATFSDTQVHQLLNNAQKLYTLTLDYFAAHPVEE